MDLYDQFRVKVRSRESIVSWQIYRFEKNRLCSFSAWPHEAYSKHIYPTPLARVGLYYCGPGDTVKCFNCDIEISGWEAEDLPFHQHLEKSPGCLFLRDLWEVGNVPFGNPNFSIRDIRQRETEIIKQRSIASIPRRVIDPGGGPTGATSESMLLSEMASSLPADDGSIDSGIGTAESSLQGSSDDSELERLQIEYKTKKMEKEILDICSRNEQEIQELEKRSQRLQKRTLE